MPKNNIQWNICVPPLLLIFQLSKSVCPVLATIVQKLDGAIHQGPVVQKLDNTIHCPIHWLNHYPLNSAIGSRDTYPLNIDLSGG